ncbi:aspartate/glutamate racemase family protein [Paenibacillus sp. HJGM_3]|uniref:aspartate/glutamate racemase family protein n=1 Tax=Paenibacillus sp. HJGM_3 TaxID=3379816 RepID=UPI00385EEEA9
MKTIACYHAHHANIEAIEQALMEYEVELVHYVDPGLDRIKRDADFRTAEAERKVVETLNWMTRCHADALLITCTYFAAMLKEEERVPANDALPSIPVIAIDEPLFAEAARENRSLVFVFTNPSTVEGTMKRLSSYAKQAGSEVQAEHDMLDGTFELFMRGRTEEYHTAVADGLSRLVRQRPNAAIYAAQLSMATAARRVERTTGVRIGNPLDALMSRLEQAVQLERRR